MKMDFRKLNKKQSQAVRHGVGPLLIIAGAGTGKTTVITERIKWLISKNLAKPVEILALTFTDKAAKEMEERVDIAMPYGYTQMFITTFHSFGEKILRQEALEIGLDPGYKLMTQAESIIFFRKNLFRFALNYFRPLGNPTKFIEGMLQHFERLKDEDVEPSQYIKWANKQRAGNREQSEEEKVSTDKYIELANAYRTYEELKVKEGVMDFSDLISNTLLLFRKRQNILRHYQEQFKYILIDEFQDTNFAQNELAILLAGRGKNITVVGDDDQAIYRWRGAAISNIIQFRSRFPKAKMVVLTENYRSSEEILDSAYKLIQFNNPDRLEVKEKFDKKLVSARKLKGEKIEFIREERVEDEVEEVVKKIKYIKKSCKDEKDEEVYDWKDFAVLIRANSQAEPFVRGLVRAGIPYQFLGPGMLFRQPEIKDLIAYLTLLSDISDSVAVYRVLSMPIFGINIRDLSSINNFARRVGLSTFEAIEAVVAYHKGDKDHWSMEKNYGNFLPFISIQTKEKLAKLTEMVERHLKLVKTETAGQILYFFLEDAGLLRQFTEYKSVKEERTAQNISKFFNKLKSFEAGHDDASVQAVIDWINMSMELGESPLAADVDWMENDAVNILTVHSSKGLEFPNVFLVNLVAGRFPTTERREKIPIPDELVKEILPEGDYHLEEERRLFYVGVTRARDRFILSAANYYGEGKRERKISTFVGETLDIDLAMLGKNSSKEKIKQLTLLEWKKVEELPRNPIRQPINYLSYSQIDTFTTCPLQYKYRYILKIPVPPSAAGSFGSSMHEALQTFYERIKRGEKLDKEKLLKILDEVWLPVGYGSRQYEDRMKERGREMLTNFFEKFYNPEIIPQSLEQVFKIRLSPTLAIGGKIDRVDITSEGKIEVIDYKTGRRPTEKEIRENLQMTVYALAATDRGIYNKKAEDVILSFYFFDQYEKVSSTRSEEQLVQAREDLLGKAQEISISAFEPKVGPWCDFCDFRLICEAWQ
ncbi:ATP-dependent helicase [Patescibacteria group bacterium]|nr:ATP-dependent helicase [Patescibacteria group bacterium]